MSFQSAIRSGPEAYLAKDHQMPERLFLVIVRGRYAGAPEESEEEFLWWVMCRGGQALVQPLMLSILQVKVLPQELPIYLGSYIRLRRR